MTLTFEGPEQSSGVKTAKMQVGEYLDLCIKQLPLHNLCITYRRGTSFKLEIPESMRHNSEESKSIRCAIFPYSHIVSLAKETGSRLRTPRQKKRENALDAKKV